MCVVDFETANRKWLLTLIKVKHTIISPWRGIAFKQLDTWPRVLFSVFISGRIWVSPCHHALLVPLLPLT